MAKNKTRDYLMEVQQFVDEKRQSNQERHEWRQAMLGSIGASLAQFGISKVQIGDESLDFSSTNPMGDKQEFEHLLKTCKSLYVLSVDYGYTSFMGKEKIAWRDQPLESLVDTARIKALAPDCVIYAPQDSKPWSHMFGTDSFEIIVTDYAQLTKLWQDISSWLKTAWFDGFMKEQKYCFAARDLFNVSIIHDIAPDLCQRWQAMQDAQEEKSQWATHQYAVVQKNLKTALSAMIEIEDHPLFAKEVQQLMQTVTPLLAHSMQGKHEEDNLDKKARKACEVFYKSYERLQVVYKAWSPELPIKPVHKNKKK